MPELKDLLRNGDAEAGAAVASVPEPELPEGACPQCRGVGFVRRELPLSDPDFGKAVPCACVARESDAERLSRLQRYSNLGPLTRLTFETLNRLGLSPHAQDKASFQRCVDDAEQFAQDPEGWIVLMGASGRGKTHIGAAIANRCLELGTPALFVVVPDLLDHLRAAYKPDAEVSYDQLLEQVRTAPVLVLDDLGTESGTPWAQEKLFQIINDRYNTRLPTVLTSNRPLRRIDERLRTRLTDPTLARVYDIGRRSVLEHQDINALFQPRIRSMTFDNFDVRGHALPEQERESLVSARASCVSYAGDPDGWIVLTGSPGCGKTHLAAAIANFRLHAGDLPLFVKTGRLLQLIRSTFDQDAELRLLEVLEEVQNASLLVLDDLFFRPSKAYKSEWANEQLFELVDYRYEKRLPTVFTTALTEAAMQTDEIGFRFAARLFDYGIAMEVQIRAPAYKLAKQPAARKAS
ncbi:MAG: ATP-binding protein [Dehalococcoidia bacterium]